MIQGQRIKIRTEDRGEKVWGRVVDVEQHTDMIDITMGPEVANLGIRPDTSRRYAPGRTSVRITVELEL
jgi:hypothetical protein